MYNGIIFLHFWPRYDDNNNTAIFIFVHNHVMSDVISDVMSDDISDVMSGVI